MIHECYLHGPFDTDWHTQCPVSEGSDEYGWCDQCAQCVTLDGQGHEDYCIRHGMMPVLRDFDDTDWTEGETYTAD
jgi:hypothetical protein